MISALAVRLPRPENYDVVRLDGNVWEEVIHTSIRSAGLLVGAVCDLAGCACRRGE